MILAPLLNPKFAIGLAALARELRVRGTIKTGEDAMIWTTTSRLAIAAGVVLALSVDLASAAPARVKSNTNLRQGPGTNFGVTATGNRRQHR